MPSFKRLLGYMRPYWLPALLAPLFMVFEVAMDLWQPKLMRAVVDYHIPQHDLPGTLHIGKQMLLVAVLGLVGGGGCSIFATIAGYSFGTDVRAALMRKVQGLSFANLDALQTGKLITRLTNDVDQVQEAAMMVMRILVRAPLLAVGSLVMAITTYADLSPLILVMSPVLVITFVVVSRKGHRLFLAVQERLDRVNVVLQENLAGARLVRAFVRAGHENQRFGGANDELMDRTVRAATLVATLMPVMMLTLNLGIALAIWIGGYQVHRGRAQLGQLMAFYSYLVQMLGSLMMLGMVVVRFAQAEASAQRITEVLDAEPALHDTDQPVPAAPARGELVFDHVEFRYAGERAEPVLQGLSFTAQPGTTVAVVGATGSGKSSLAHLVPRFYDVTSGQVLLDGVDVRELGQSDLRGMVAIVPQETTLFSGTIRDNLRYGRPDAGDEEVQEAARLACAHEFISGLAEGYDTALGHGGAGLSGGQRQRLAIARALLCRPAVLVMDDCTSAVDAGTEAQILHYLATWSHRCTRLVIAQRITSVRGADQILVLEDGQVTAAGTHEELLHGSPTYRDIVNSQVEGPETADGD